MLGFLIYINFMRLLKTNPVLTIFNSYLVDNPEPSTISYLWNFGSLLGLSLVAQIVTGILLGMHYAGTAELAFNSVEHKINNFELKVKYIKYNKLLLNYKDNSNEIEIDNTINLNKKSSSYIIDNNIRDDDFFEWFRGLVDGEGSFSVYVSKDLKIVTFNFIICMHKDDAPLLFTLSSKLKIGVTRIGKKYAYFSIRNKEGFLKLINIFDKKPLNTSKSLDYLKFKKCYYLWNNRDKKDEINNLNIKNEIVSLKNSMNKKKIGWKQSDNHKIVITPYWLLGFVEGEGSFSINRKSYQLTFSLGQNAKELDVLIKIQEFLLNLPGNYKLSRSNIKIIYLEVQKKGYRTSKPMARISVSMKEYLNNVLVPLFDSLVWFSKKEKDYKDWKIVLNFKNEGKHFMKEGQELIEFIYLRMNQRRLSSNISCKIPTNLNERISILLKAPSNYEIHKNGKIYIKSKGTYLKGIGTINIEVFNKEGVLINKFNSRSECARYFNLSDTTIGNRLNDNKAIYYNNQYFIIKRAIIYP